MAKQRDTYFKYQKDNFLDKVNKSRRLRREAKELKNRYSRKTDAPMHIALVVDGLVEDVMHCDERLAMLLMSEPLVIEIDADSPVTVNWLYDKDNERFYELGDE